MQSLAYIPASNQATNASLMTVQNVRSSGASDIIVNTVTGAPTKFYASMGAPHTFTDPVTGETITIISEATAVDFAGHIDSGKIVIDAIAPGYTDTRGSLVGDIVVIRPITEWANNIFNVLSQSHNDDGTIKNSAVTYNANVFDHIQSGAVLAGLGYGANLNASLSAGVAYINGIRQTIAAIATRAYTGSKDTYVDALYNASGIATIVYTEVANNAASPALAANSIRLGIIITGANIAAATSINQGQEDRVLPIASGYAYSVTDSLGNLIAPRDPQRKVLGFRQTFTNFNTTSNPNQVQVPGISVPIVVPLGRKIKVTYGAFYMNSSASGTYAEMGIWEGVVNSGTRKAWATAQYGGSSTLSTLTCLATYTPTSQNITLNGGLNAAGGATTATIAASPAVQPIYMLVELV